MNRIKQLFCFCFNKKRVLYLMKAWLYLLSLSFMIYIGHTREAKMPGKDILEKDREYKNAKDNSQYLDSVYFVLSVRCSVSACSCVWVADNHFLKCYFGLPGKLRNQ